MDFTIIKGSKVLITGATGLIGKAIVFELLKMGCHVVAVVRNKEKATMIFNNNVEIIVCDIKDFPIDNLGVDYVIHTAANTSSFSFVNEPVSVIKDNIIGTNRVLEFAKINNCKGFVYLSTMEIYGHPDSEERIDECHGSNLDTMDVRSSYPESKRVCECLCTSFYHEYRVPAKVIRLTQTFGKGTDYNDKRVFAEFARCAIENRDIVLHTDGSTKRSYLYLEDAVKAILFVLIYGKPGEAYNAANEETFCSILEMAELVAQRCMKNQISVIIEEDKNNKQYGYAPKLMMNLSSEKLRNLGWAPTVGLKEMFDLLINDMKNNK